MSKNNVTLQFKWLGKEQTKPKASIIKEIKIRAEISEITEKLQDTNETKSWFFKKRNKIGKSLIRWSENKNSLKSEIKVGTASTEIKGIIRVWTIVYQQIEKFQWDGQIPRNKNLPRLNHEKIRKSVDL